MKNLFSIFLLFGFFTQLRANESMVFRCDGRTIDIIGDKRDAQPYSDVESLEVNIEEDVIRWSGEEVELYDGFFDDGRITFYDESTNIQIKLDKLTGILTETRLYPRTSSNDLFIMTYQCKKITSKPLW